ncbi:MAG: hypothetical protein ACRCZP_09430 [Phycicoccus sp.]
MTQTERRTPVRFVAPGATVRHNYRRHTVTDIERTVGLVTVWLDRRGHETVLRLRPDAVVVVMVDA